MVMAVCAARLTFCFVASFEDILLTGLPCERSDSLCRECAVRIAGVCLFLVGTLLSAESPRQLTLLLKFDGQPSTTSMGALDSELRGILAASHVPLRLTLLTEPLLGDVRGELVVFQMRGSCSMQAIPVAALSDERGPLAMTHMVNGEMLPFADVECDRVRTAVQRTMGSGNSESRQVQYGVALARVMAHELYHMLAKSTVHDARGLTKSGLSSRELSSGNMQLSGAASAAISSR